MPNPDTPDLVIARDQEEWRKCAVALLWALTNGSVGKLDKWESHFKMLVQAYADLQAEGKIKLLRGYEALEAYEDFLARQAKKEKDKGGK